VHQQAWPEANADLAKAETFTLVVQVNGKVRDKFDVPLNITEDAAKEMAFASANVERQIAGQEIVRVLFVPRRLVNIVVKG
jgi:leucyl-tRNA synthetase